MSFRLKIENTDFFKGLNSVQKNMTLKAQNRGAIENGFNICVNRGVEYWKTISGQNYINTGIILELTKDLK